MNELTVPVEFEFDLSTDDCTLTVPGFRFTIRGMEMDGVPTFDQWDFAMRVLGTVSRRVVKPFKLWVCLMLLTGEAHYGETYAQAIEATGIPYQTLANCRSTLRRYLQPDGSFDPGVWHPELSFEHHDIVSRLPADERESWLARAEREHFTTDDLREAMKGGTSTQKPTYDFACPECGAILKVTKPVILANKE